MSTKSGIKTSEFWVGTLTAPVVAVIVAVLNSIGIEVSDITVATLIAPALLYIFGRGWIKKELAKGE